MENYKLNQEYSLLDVKDAESAKKLVKKILNGEENKIYENERFNKLEANLLEALILYVVKENAEEKRNINTIYRLLTSNTIFIDGIFKSLPIDHEAKLPYSMYNLATQKVKESIVISLAVKLNCIINTLY